MDEVDCPYCWTTNYIDVADYRDDGDSKDVECSNLECGMTFKAVLSISWNYWGEIK